MEKDKMKPTTPQQPSTPTHQEFNSPGPSSRHHLLSTKQQQKLLNSCFIKPALSLQSLPHPQSPQSGDVGEMAQAKMRSERPYNSLKVSFAFHMRKNRFVDTIIDPINCGTNGLVLFSFNRSHMFEYYAHC